MKRWAATLLQKLAQRLLSVPKPGRREAPGFAAAPDWLAEDRALWRAFLGTPTGAKLLQRGRAIHCLNATAACADVFHTAHSAGCAKGFGEALDWLETLSRCSRANEPSAPDVNEEDGTAPPGETEMSEFLSP